MFKHILISTDGSSASRKAARAGVELATRLGARITGYSAFEPMKMFYAEGSYAVDQKMIDGIEKQSRAVAQKRVDAIGKLARLPACPSLR